jgi:hypothetical protein
VEPQDEKQIPKLVGWTEVRHAKFPRMLNYSKFGAFGAIIVVVLWGLFTACLTVKALRTGVVLVSQTSKNC